MARRWRSCSGMGSHTAKLTFPRAVPKEMIAASSVGHETRQFARTRLPET